MAECAEDLPIYRFADPSRPVCLNQDDEAEKAQHVPNMGEIYGSASNTWIWLGKAEDDSILGLDTISKLNQVDEGQSPGVARTELPRLELHERNAIRDITSRPWFSRLWVVQELILSRNPVILSLLKLG